MKRIVVLIACLMFSAPALAQSVGEKSGVNLTLGISPTTADFVKEAGIGEMFEVESTALVRDKGSASEKAFAALVMADHVKTSTELAKLVMDGKVKAELPKSLDSSHQGKLDKLKAIKGRDFSSNFHVIQVNEHKNAISLFERYAKGGDNTELKSWAVTTLPALKRHLEMAQAMAK